MQLIVAARSLPRLASSLASQAGSCSSWAKAYPAPRLQPLWHRTRGLLYQHSSELGKRSTPSTAMFDASRSAATKQPHNSGVDFLKPEPRNPVATVAIKAALLVATVCVWTVCTLSYGFRFVLNPRKSMQRKDRSQLQISDPLPNMEHEMLEVNGVRLHVVSPGRKPSKPLMLLVHGFPEGWRSWRHQMEEFKDDFDVVSFDLRGYGLSDKPPGANAYATHILAKDVTGLVKALGHDHCSVLVGHDWGGAIVYLTVAMYPSLFDRFIIMAAPHWGLYMKNLDWRQMLASWYFLLFQAPWLPEALLLENDAAAIKAFFTPGNPAGPVTPGCLDANDAEYYQQQIQRPGAATAALNFYRSKFGQDNRVDEVEASKAWAKPISLPALVLWGDSDTALKPILNKGIEQVVPNVEVIVFEKCSHWVQQDKPKETNAVMRAFLART